MTNATPKGVALPIDLEDLESCPNSKCETKASRQSAQGFRTYTQAEINREAWAIAYEEQEARRCRQREIRAAQAAARYAGRARR